MAAASQTVLGSVSRPAARPGPAVLDWSHDHTMVRPRPCRHCGEVTNLKDDAGRASHKVCAERAHDAKDGIGASRVDRGPETETTPARSGVATRHGRRAPAVTR